ncbi:hypothetical protein DEO72_LG4g488 [Vigna unguiculata]|uniref:Uncharacterized protein n=1 Tax=Vigna unguiculata TaxID=3917 RepID=A0A4D6LL93_VIGUN|nr:hypothetical protein DEO72_LG4g488 [Vigna unguiculata]
MGGTLEVDESHLHAFMRHCSETTSFIPGSARNFQVVLMNYKASQGHSTQQFMEDIATTTFARDFGTNVWKWATMFMKHHGLVDEGDIKNVTTMFTTKRVDRLPFVACVVKDYKPNGLGDLFITMKDQTHTAQANIHNKAVSNLECGLQIGVEFVILLKEFGVDAVANVLRPVAERTVGGSVATAIERSFGAGTGVSCLWFNHKFWLIYGGNAGVVWRCNICESACVVLDWGLYPYFVEHALKRSLFLRCRHRSSFGA